MEEYQVMNGKKRELMYFRALQNYAGKFNKIGHLTAPLAPHPSHDFVDFILLLFVIKFIT